MFSKYQLIKNVPSFIISIRYHQKFSKTLLQQQTRLLDKFDREIKDTMEKIQTNQKVKIKRKKAALSQTTGILMGKQQSTNNSSNVYSSGSPEQLVIQRDGMKKSFLSTRMRILNTNFLRFVTEIFVTDEEFSEKMNEYKFRITDVRVSIDYHFLQVYWTTEIQNEDHKTMVASYLNNNKGRLHELLCESQLGQNVPWILFVYDLQVSYEQEINSRLEQCRSDLENTKENSDSVNNIDTNQLNLKNQIIFDESINLEIQNLEENLNKLKYKSNPNDYKRLGMPQDVFSKNSQLDYESLYQKVLQNMHRTRVEHTQDMANLKHLETIPINNENNILENKTRTHEVIEYDTENRIKAIKKFVWMNRKRKDKLERKLKRMLLSEEIDRFDDYEQLKEFIEEKYSSFHEEDNTEENYSRSEDNANH